MSAYTASGSSSSSNNSYVPLPNPPPPPPPPSHTHPRRRSDPPSSVPHHHQTHLQPRKSSIHSYNHSHNPVGVKANSLSAHTPPRLADSPISQSYSYNSIQSPYTDVNSSVGAGLEEQKDYAAAQSTSGDKLKGNRLRKACDSCSIRKVKCDESGPPCRACAALDIPCTFDRPSRRRGPPNRHSEAIKKRRIESPGATLAYISSPEPSNNVAASLASFPSQAILNADSICPFSTLELLVDGFFTYIHPLCPFPHEPSFRAAFTLREDITNPSFLALLASMIGVLVASFPREPWKHLKAQRREHLFPNSMSLVERCHNVAVKARDAGNLEKNLTIYDAVTSYFLGLTGAYTFQWKQARLYFGETITIMGILGAHRVRDPHSQPVTQISSPHGAIELAGIYHDTQTRPVDFIRQEIARRVFWAIFVSVRTMQQLGALVTELLIPPPTPTHPYPPLPLEVDDKYIFIDHVDSQPTGVLSLLTGYNLNIKIYTTVTPLTTIELTYGIDEIFGWDHQKNVLENCLSDVKQVLDNPPPELLLHPKPLSPKVSSDDQEYFSSYRGECSDPSETAQLYQQGNTEAERRVQFEIQKANIYVSQLATRSYLTEKYSNLLKIHERTKSEDQDSLRLSSPSILAPRFDETPGIKSSDHKYEELVSKIALERDIVVKDLLVVLSAIIQVNMEPNSVSFHNKIRQIASTLVETSKGQKGPIGVKADVYLSHLCNVLTKLERNTPGSLDGFNASDEEEEELRSWADMREYQMAFARAGGFVAQV